MSTIAERLAAFATSPELESDASLGVRMIPYVTDMLAVILAGSTAPSSQAVARTLLEASGKPEATIVGAGASVSAWDAALANGTAAHALELDDDHRIAVLHPGAVVVPAALAAAEAEGASGATFLRALLVGYEITCRLGAVFRGTQFYHGLHPTSLCGVFGAAGAAAVALGLDRTAFVSALGIAGTQASGLTEWRTAGTWIKRLHPGRAAQTGVLSARLARQGFTGPSTIFEGPGGFYRAYAFGETLDEGAMTRGLGKDFSAFGTALKPFPCCRFGHGALDLALLARQDGVSPDDVDGIDVRIYRTDVLTYHPEPKSVVDAQFNLPYGVALALLNGNVTLKDYTEEAIRNRDVLALCRKISVVEDPQFSADYPQDYKVALTISLRDGGTRTYFSDCPNGDPDAARYRDAPGLFLKDAEAKAVSLLDECGFAGRVTGLMKAIDGLPDASGLGALCRHLNAPADAIGAAPGIARGNAAVQQR